MLPERWCPVGRSTDSLHRVTSGTERGRSPQSGTTLYGSDSEGPDGPLGSHRAPCGDCLRLGVRDPGECCRVTVRDACGSASLCGRLGADRISAENYLSSQMGSRNANSETALMLCAKKGLHGTAALLLTAESGLRAGRPVCQERVGMTARVCGRGQCSRVCKARGRSVRGRRDSSYSCCHG